MFRGAQKRIIVLKSPSGRCFEEAFFIVKDDFPGENAPKVRDLVKEANRILQESRLPKGRGEDRSQGRFSRLLWFAFGMISSAILTAVLLWFLL